MATSSHSFPAQPSGQSAIDWAEMTLKAGYSHEFLAFQDCLLILVPLLGEVCLNGDFAVDVGHCWRKSLRTGEVILLQNRYENTENHFLRIQIPFSGSVKSSITCFSQEELQNCIFPIFTFIEDEVSIKLGLGKFKGRTDLEFTVRGTVYAYCLVGAFEVQNCLLEKGDALKISHSKKVELEALSPNAFLFTLET
ncbi:hypothetical protein [Algoriphagus sp. Y33]|uniref:pirin family protein n=1 Tax=Algoriphagus sp. Y33 TaxID=2772483 RepID=UPI0017827D44|nr:hypothetical protein [Algoriphagus sp. Y33]